MGRKLGRPLGLLDFLDLMEEIGEHSPGEPAPEGLQVESTLRPSARLERQARLPLRDLLPSVSYSQLESYQLCPLRFSQGTEKTSMKRRLGNSIHQALCTFYRLPVHDRTLSRLHQVLDDRWQASPRDIQEHSYWREQAHEMLQALYHSEDVQVSPAAVESGFVFSAGDFAVRGKVDRVDRVSAGQYEVIDYKVFRDDPRDEREASESLQSVCLYFGTHSLFGAFPVAVTYLHVDTGLRVSFTPEPAKMEEGLAKIEDLVREMTEASSFPAIRNRFCSACQLHGQCPATRMGASSSK